MKSFLFWKGRIWEGREHKTLPNRKACTLFLVRKENEPWCSCFYAIQNAVHSSSGLRLMSRLHTRAHTHTICAVKIVTPKPYRTAEISILASIEQWGRKKVSSQKWLAMFLDSRVNFTESQVTSAWEFHTIRLGAKKGWNISHFLQWPQTKVKL